MTHTAPTPPAADPMRPFENVQDAIERCMAGSAVQAATLYGPTGQAIASSYNPRAEDCMRELQDYAATEKLHDVQIETRDEAGVVQVFLRDIVGDIERREGLDAAMSLVALCGMAIESELRPDEDRQGLSSNPLDEPGSYNVDGIAAAAGALGAAHACSRLAALTVVRRAFMVNFEAPEDGAEDSAEDSAEEGTEATQGRARDA